MSSTNKTTNYQLSQFVGTDIPSILNDYNGDMRKIDTAIKEVSVAGGDSATAIAVLESTVNGHTSEISQQRTAVNGLSGRVIAIEDKIPANASASNKLVTVSDIPEVPSITGLEDRVENIEEVIPSNASASNKLITIAEIPQIANLTETLIYSVTATNDETYAELLRSILTHMPNIPASLLTLKVNGRVFKPINDIKSEWCSFNLYNGNLDIQAVELILSGCTFTGLSSSTTAPYFQSFDFSSNRGGTVSLYAITIE